MEILVADNQVHHIFAKDELARRAYDLNRVLSDILDQGVEATTAEMVALIALQLKELFESIIKTGGDITHLAQNSALERAFGHLGDYRGSRIVQKVLMAIGPV